MPEQATAQKLSTTALAKVLHVSAQQLFSLLKDCGWIKRVDDAWLLTGKGEFEGGDYVQSQRYGRYIVWPATIAEHPLLKSLESNKTLTARAIGKPFGLSAREVNRIFSELGWIRHDLQGWVLTQLGCEQQGVQLENEHSGAFYVVWPEGVQQQLQLLTQLQRVSPGSAPPSEAGRYCAMDGHQHNSVIEMRVCDWLYLAGLVHACHRKLPSEEPLIADFYLPSEQLYIECWGEHASAEGICHQLQRKEFYAQSGLKVVDVECDDLAHLDEVMTRELRRQGVRVY
jgi:hypothetical protein